MPKMKSKSGARKRFKLTATGKVRFYRAGKKHILTKKSPKRMRHLRKAGIMTDGDARHVHRELPSGGGV